MSSESNVIFQFWSAILRYHGFKSIVGTHYLINFSGVGYLFLENIAQLANYMCSDVC